MNARDTIYQELLERLTHGRYQAGEPLIPQTLSEEFIDLARLQDLHDRARLKSPDATAAGWH